MSGHPLKEMPVPDVPDEAPAPGEDFAAQVFDVTNLPDIDESEHTLDCPCGCGGDALVLSEVDVGDAYIASTVTVATFDP